MHPKRRVEVDFFDRKVAPFIWISGGAVTRHACPRPFKIVRWKLKHAVRSPFPLAADEAHTNLCPILAACSARVLCRVSRHAPCQASLDCQASSHSNSKDGAGAKRSSSTRDSSSILVKQRSILVRSAFLRRKGALVPGLCGGPRN